MFLLSDESEESVDSVFQLTFVPADFYISKEANFDNLPEQSQDQVGFSSHQIRGINIHHHTADSRGWVQAQDQILLQIQRNLCLNTFLFSSKSAILYSKQQVLKTSAQGKQRPWPEFNNS